jgi:hypothetical protein
MMPRSSSTQSVEKRGIVAGPGLITMLQITLAIVLSIYIRSL